MRPGSLRRAASESSTKFGRVEKDDAALNNSRHSPCPARFAGESEEIELSTETQGEPLRPPRLLVCPPHMLSPLAPGHKL